MMKKKNWLAALLSAAILIAPNSASFSAVAPAWAAESNEEEPLSADNIFITAYSGNPENPKDRIFLNEITEQNPILVDSTGDYITPGHLKKILRFYSLNKDSSYHLIDNVKLYSEGELQYYPGWLISFKGRIITENSDLILDNLFFRIVANLGNNQGFSWSAPFEPGQVMYVDESYRLPNLEDNLAVSLTHRQGEKIDIGLNRDVQYRACYQLWDPSTKTWKELLPENYISQQVDPGEYRILIQGIYGPLENGDIIGYLGEISIPFTLTSERPASPRKIKNGRVLTFERKEPGKEFIISYYGDSISPQQVGKYVSLLAEDETGNNVLFYNTDLEILLERSSLQAKNPGDTGTFRVKISNEYYEPWISEPYFFRIKGYMDPSFCTLGGISLSPDETVEWPSDNPLPKLEQISLTFNQYAPSFLLTQGKDYEISYWRINNLDIPVRLPESFPESDLPLKAGEYFIRICGRENYGNDMDYFFRVEGEKEPVKQIVDYYQIRFVSESGETIALSSPIEFLREIPDMGEERAFQWLRKESTFGPFPDREETSLSKSIDLNWLIKELPRGYVIVESENNLSNISFQNFTPTSSHVEDGTIVRNLEQTIQIRKSDSSTVNSLSNLKDGLPVLLSFSSDEDIFVTDDGHFSNTYKLSLGTQEELKKIQQGLPEQQDQKFMLHLLQILREQTCYPLQPLVLPFTFEQFIQDLVPITCNDKIIAYQSQTVFDLNNPVSGENPGEFQTDFSHIGNFLIKVDSDSLFGLIDIQKKAQFETWLEGTIENKKYNYSFDVDLSQSLAVLDEEVVNLFLNLKAKLSENSTIRLIFSELRDYLDQLENQRLAVNEKKFSSPAGALPNSSKGILSHPLILAKTENILKNFMAFEEKQEEEIVLELSVSDLKTSDQALEVIRTALTEQYGYSADTVQKANLDSQVAQLENMNLQSQSFPVKLGEAVEIRLESNSDIPENPDNPSKDPDNPSKDPDNPSKDPDNPSKDPDNPSPKPTNTPQQPNFSGHGATSARPSGGISSRPSSPVDSKPEEQKPASGSQGRKALYRFYNKVTGEHFFTSDENERKQLEESEFWSSEGQGWTTPEISDYPIYRLCNPNNGDHHYTLDRNEYETLQTLGWKDEGIGLYSASAEEDNAVELYRLYNPNAKEAGSHHYTLSAQERDALISFGWKDEGIAWHGLCSEE